MEGEKLQTTLERILTLLEPVLWAVGAGAAADIAEYLSSAKTPDFTMMKAAALTGAATGFLAYMRKPRHKD